MNDNIMKNLPEFLSEVGLDEEPMGIFYTDGKCSGRCSIDTGNLF